MFCVEINFVRGRRAAAWVICGSRRNRSGPQPLAAKARCSSASLASFAGCDPKIIFHSSFFIAPLGAQQPTAAVCLRGVLCQDRSRSDRQPAAAPGRRAAPYGRRPVRSAAGLPFSNAVHGLGRTALRRSRPRKRSAGRSFARRRNATRVPQVRFVRSFASCSPQMLDKCGSEWIYSRP